MQTTRLVLVAIASLVHVDAFESYDGFQVFRTLPESLEHIESLRRMEMREEYSFWNEIVLGRAVDIMVSPDFTPKLKTDLAIRAISYEIMITDVEERIKLERLPAAIRDVVSADHSMTWDAYHSQDDMHTFLDYLEATYDFVTTETIGKSFEGRAMRVAKICRGGCGNKPAAWIDGGIHAREWISPATVTWMLKELVENDADHPDLTENMDWYILPVHNPDGYEYTRTDERMWRKTRSDNEGTTCKGTDANRNWGYHWNEGGSSNDPCSITYHGPEPWSEIENVNVRDFINTIKDKLVFYNSIHSYSQLILLPWGYTYDLPNDYGVMEEVFLHGSDALTAVHGKYYETGCIPCMLYIASGSSMDWAHGDAGIPFTTSMELRDTGIYGFILPPDQIIPTAEETWAFHLTVMREIMTMV